MNAAVSTQNQNEKPTFSVYPVTVLGSTTRSHSVYPVTVTLLQPAITSTRWYHYI